MSKLSILKEFWDFLKVRKKWWLTPIVLFLIVLGALIVFAGGSAFSPSSTRFFKKRMPSPLLRPRRPEDPVIDFIVGLAQDAGRVVMAHYRQASGRRRYKDDDSPVTAADLAANRLIVAALKKFDPRIPVISEESPIPPYASRRGWKAFWLVDPVDGTREFLKRTGHFTVNIGLVRNGVPVAGVVFAPALDVLYFGSAVSGSWKIEGSARPRRIFPKTPRPGQGPKILVSRLHESETVLEQLRKIPGARLIRVGSSLKFGLVAEGRAHAYPRFGPTSEWDVAAGDAVWRYAAPPGQTNPSPLKYNKTTLKNRSFYIGWRPRTRARAAS